MRQTLKHHRPVILLLVLLLAFGLRVHGLAQESLWVDEGYSISLSQHSPSEIIRGTAADQHPPLYYLLLHVWLKAGSSLFHIRLLSAFLGLLSVALMALLGRWMDDEWVAIGGSILLAILPMHIWYSQEARMYILLSGLGIASTGFTWVISQGRARRAHWLGYLLSSAAGIYTHNLYFFLLPIQNLIVIVRALRGQEWRRLAGWLGGQVSLAVIYLPWLPTAIYQARHHSMTWLAAPGWPVLRDSVVYTATGLTRARGDLYTLALAWTAVALLLPLITWRRQDARGRTTSLGLLWFMIPVLALYAISQHYPLYQNKQLLIFVPGLVILVVQAARSLPRPLAGLMVALLSLMMGVALYDLYTVDDKHGWRETAGYLAEEWQEGDVVYLNPAAASPTLRYYLPQSVPTAGYPPGYDIIRGGWKGKTVTATIAESELIPLIKRYDRVWLIQFSATFWDPGRQLSSVLAEHGELVTTKDFRGVEVQLYQTRHDG